MRKLYKKYDITNVPSADVMRRFGAYGGDVIIKNEGDKVFILIPI